MGITVDSDAIIDAFREANHFDILLEINSSIEKDNNPLKTIIIENKVKSLPDYKQLREYDKKYGGKKRLRDKPKFYLLSLIEPDKDKLENWEWISYERISYALKNTLKKLVDTNSLPELIGDLTFAGLVTKYCEFIDMLCELAKILKTQLHDNFDFYDANYQGIDFKKLRLHDLMLKFKYCEIKEFIIGAIEKKKIAYNVVIDPWDECNDLNCNHLYFGSGFTNGLGLVDVKIFVGYFMAEGNNRIPHFISIQLQGNHLRYASELIKFEGVSQTKIKSIHENIINGLIEKWLKNPTLSDDKLNITKGRYISRANSGLYNQFGSVFLYKYDILNNQISIQEVVECFINLVGYGRKIVPVIKTESSIPYLP